MNGKEDNSEDDETSQKLDYGSTHNMCATLKNALLSARSRHKTANDVEKDVNQKNNAKEKSDVLICGKDDDDFQHLNKSYSPVLKSYFERHVENIIQTDADRQLCISQCGQKAPQQFVAAFPYTSYNRLERFEAGTYSVVFRGYDSEINKMVVFKVIRAISLAIYQRFNGISFSGSENYSEILNELLITRALSSLHDAVYTDNRIKFMTHCFPRVIDANVVVGEIPEYLLNEKSDENQSLSSTKHEPYEDYPQLCREFVVLKMKFCGEPLWRMIKHRRVNASQLWSVAKQICYGLAVAEGAFQFEHRDLHVSNILLKPTEKNRIKFIIRSQQFSVPSLGYKAIIIDTTFSRIKIDNNVYYRDMRDTLQCKDNEGEDETKPISLQEVIYQSMVKETNNDWKKWTSKTNILWLHYLFVTLDRSEIVRKSDDGLIKESFKRMIKLVTKYNNIADFIPNLVNI